MAGGNTPLQADVLSLLEAFTGPEAVEIDIHFNSRDGNCSSLPPRGLRSATTGQKLPQHWVLALAHALLGVFPEFEGSTSGSERMGGRCQQYSPTVEVHASYKAACGLLTNLLGLQGSSNGCNAAPVANQPHQQKHQQSLDLALLAGVEKAVHVLPHVAPHASSAADYLSTACALLSTFWQHHASQFMGDNPAFEAQDTHRSAQVDGTQAPPSAAGMPMASSGGPTEALVRLKDLFVSCAVPAVMQQYNQKPGPQTLQPPLALLQTILGAGERAHGKRFLNFYKPSTFHANRLSSFSLAANPVANPGHIGAYNCFAFIVFKLSIPRHQANCNDASSLFISRSSGVALPALAHATELAACALELSRSGWLSFCFELLDVFCEHSSICQQAWLLLLVLAELSSRLIAADVNADEGRHEAGFAAGQPDVETTGGFVSPFSLTAAYGAGSSALKALQEAARLLMAHVHDTDALLQLLSSQPPASASQHLKQASGHAGQHRQANNSRIPQGYTGEPSFGWAGQPSGGGNDEGAWRLLQRAVLGLLQVWVQCLQLPAPPEAVRASIAELFAVEERCTFLLR